LKVGIESVWVCKVVQGHGWPGGVRFGGCAAQGGCCALAKHSINKLCCHEIYKSANGEVSRMPQSQGSMEEQWVVLGWLWGGAACLAGHAAAAEQKAMPRPRSRAASDPNGTQTDVALWLLCGRCCCFCLCLCLS